MSVPKPPAKQARKRKRQRSPSSESMSPEGTVEFLERRDSDDGLPQLEPPKEEAPKEEEKKAPKKRERKAKAKEEKKEEAKEEKKEEAKEEKKEEAKEIKEEIKEAKQEVKEEIKEEEKKEELIMEEQQELMDEIREMIEMDPLFAREVIDVAESEIAYMRSEKAPSIRSMLEEPPPMELPGQNKRKDSFDDMRRLLENADRQSEDESAEPEVKMANYFKDDPKEEIKEEVKQVVREIRQEVKKEVKSLYMQQFLKAVNYTRDGLMIRDEDKLAAQKKMAQKKPVEQKNPGKQLPEKVIHLPDRPKVKPPAPKKGELPAHLQPEDSDFELLNYTIDEERHELTDEGRRKRLKNLKERDDELDRLRAIDLKNDKALIDMMKKRKLLARKAVDILMSDLELDVAQFKTPPPKITGDGGRDLIYAEHILEEGMDKCIKYADKVMEMLAYIAVKGPWKYTQDDEPWKPFSLRSQYDQEKALLPSATKRDPNPQNGDVSRYTQLMVRNILPFEAIRDADSDKLYVKRTVDMWFFDQENNRSIIRAYLKDRYQQALDHHPTEPDREILDAIKHYPFFVALDTKIRFDRFEIRKEIDERVRRYLKAQENSAEYRLQVKGESAAVVTAWLKDRYMFCTFLGYSQACLYGMYTYLHAMCYGAVLDRQLFHERIARQREEKRKETINPLKEQKKK